MANRKTTAAEEAHDPETGEVTETKAALPAVTVANGVATINGQAFEIAEKVTLPLLAQQNGMTYFVRIDSEVYTGKEIKGSKMQAADMIRVTNLVDGHEYEMICNAVLKGILEDNFPKAKGGYVGKHFAIHRIPPNEGRGKKYATYGVTLLKPKA